MLNEEQIQNNKIKYLQLLARLGVDLTDFSEYLDKIDYFHKPATLQYTGAYAGGLCEKAISVAYELGSLADAYYSGRYDAKTIIKVALLKDLYRAEMYEPYEKNVKNAETGKWETQAAFRMKAEDERPIYGSIGYSSYMIARKYFDLSDEETEAIVLGNEISMPDIYAAMKAYPLLSLTKMADIAANYLK